MPPFLFNKSSLDEKQQSQQKQQKQQKQHVISREKFSFAGKPLFLLNFETNGAICKQSGQNAFILSEKHKIIMNYEL